MDQVPLKSRVKTTRPLVFQVREEPCDQCLFSKNRIVSKERAIEIIRGCHEEGNHFVCHKATLAGGQNICCRTFFDTQDTLVIRLAKQLNNIEFVKE